MAVSGPFAPLVDDVCEELTRRGYTPRSIRDYLYVVSLLSRWLEAKGLTVDGLTVAVVEEFFRLRKAQGHARWRTWRSVSVLLVCLGIEWAVDGPAAATPCEPLVAAYRDYLVAERGLATGTVAQYQRRARVFLSWDALGTPVEVRHSGGYRVAIDTTDGLVTALRLLPGTDQGDEPPGKLGRVEARRGWQALVLQYQIFGPRPVDRKEQHTGGDRDEPGCGGGSSATQHGHQRN